MTKKELLLQAAKEVFGECGYAETTFKKISERAGVAFGLLTHHFGTKENLFLAAGLEVLANLHSRLQTAMATGHRGLASAMGFCREYLAFSVDPKTNFLVLIRCSPCSDLKSPKGKESMQEGFRTMLKDLEAELARGMEDGSIRQAPAEAMAAAILASLVGAARTRLLTDYAPHNLYDEVLVFIECSLRPPREPHSPEDCTHALY